ncbi:MAG: molybdenum cofactor guanylyltransferase [Microcystaceae cyanobacterium]
MESFSSPVRVTLSTIILAGGHSRRMGRDKALLNVGGNPLITKICSIAQTITDQVYVVTPWSDRYRSVIPSDCHIIKEPLREDNSPLTGFLWGLSQIKTDWCLLLACDLPNLTSEVIAQWSCYLPQVPDTAIALLPRHPKGWDPLCGFYRSQCLASGQQFVQQGERSFQGWLQQQSVYPLPVVDKRVLFNCNTPQDLTNLDSESLTGDSTQ